jgi:hypothetical protein
MCPKLRKTTTLGTFRKMLGELSIQGVRLEQVPMGERPAWYNYGFNSAQDLERKLEYETFLQIDPQDNALSLIIAR